MGAINTTRSNIKTLTTDPSDPSKPPLTRWEVDVEVEETDPPTPPKITVTITVGRQKKVVTFSGKLK